MLNWLDSSELVRLLVVTSRNVSRMRRRIISLAVGNEDNEDAVRPIVGRGRATGGGCVVGCVLNLHCVERLRKDARLRLSLRLQIRLQPWKQNLYGSPSTLDFPR